MGWSNPTVFQRHSALPVPVPVRYRSRDTVMPAQNRPKFMPHMHAAPSCLHSHRNLMPPMTRTLLCWFNTPAQGCAPGLVTGPSQRHADASGNPLPPMLVSRHCSAVPPIEAGALTDHPNPDQNAHNAHQDSAQLGPVELKSLETHLPSPNPQSARPAVRWCKSEPGQELASPSPPKPT